MKIAGLILAGGRSTRFGADKAVALYRGEPFALHVARALAAIAAPLALNTRLDTEAAALASQHGWAVLQDRDGDPDGPLAGLRAGLAWAAEQGADALAFAPCDAPALTGHAFETLRDGIGAAPAACARSPEGPHPLCALWRTATLAAVEKAIEGGRHPPVQAVLRDLGGVYVPFPDAGPFINVNTRNDLARLARGPESA